MTNDPFLGAGTPDDPLLLKEPLLIIDTTAARADALAEATEPLIAAVLEKTGALLGPLARKADVALQAYRSGAPTGEGRGDVVRMRPEDAMIVAHRKGAQILGIALQEGAPEIPHILAATPGSRDLLDGEAAPDPQSRSGAPAPSPAPEWERLREAVEWLASEGLERRHFDADQREAVDDGGEAASRIPVKLGDLRLIRAALSALPPSGAAEGGWEVERICRAIYDADKTVIVAIETGSMGLCGPIEKPYEVPWDELPDHEAEDVQDKLRNVVRDVLRFAPAEGGWRPDPSGDPLVETLSAIDIYASDTLSGPAGDVVADAKWYRDAVAELRRRARQALPAPSGEAE